MPIAVEILLWVVAVQACALGVLPLTLCLFGALPDRGYGFSKVLGLLVVAYAVWLPAMLGYLDYTRPAAVVVLGVVALAAWWGRSGETLAWLRAQRRLVLAEEAILLGSGLAAACVRAFNPDIIGQEKFMDLAFFNAFLATRSLPAEDAWLSGYGMAYYPFGYLLFGLPAKLAGLAAPVGYNLALVLVFALTFLGSAALVANLLALATGREAGSAAPGRSAWAFGLVGALLVTVCGNLVGPLEILAARGFGGPEFWAAIGVKNLQANPNPAGWLPADGGWWWHGSRVIATIQPDGITEFPYFSYLLGDLHPHFMALPLLILVAGLALALLLEARPWASPALVAASGLALGVPLVANTWDAATSWTLYGLAVLAVVWPEYAGGNRRPWRTLGWGLAPIPLGLALFSPYFVGYSSQRLGLAFVTDRTPPISFLILFGPLLLIVLVFGLRFALRGGSVTGANALAVLGLGTTLGSAIAGRWTLAWCLGLLTLTLVAALRLLRGWQAEPLAWRAAGLYLAGLAALALAITAGAEVIYIRDSFGTRMNTVFKFYYHVWLLLGLAAAPAAALVLTRTGYGLAAPAPRAAAAGALGVALALGLVYPVAATWTKSNEFRGRPTLDGAAFLERSRPGDAAAIRWLAAQPRRPVVLEAFGNDYEEFARVSTFSGLPTVLGWVGHELQWRGQLAEYGQRQQDVNGFYQRAEQAEGLRILQRYGVSYVFVGSLERQKYGEQVDQQLAAWLTPVFRAPGATIYAVPRPEGAS